MEALPEKLQLHGSNHLGMILVSAPLTGNKYLNWSFGIKRALQTKMKLGFIDGTSEKPHPSDPFFEQWIRVDSKGNLPLSSYFINMRKLWDEMAKLKPTPQCTCSGCSYGASKAVEDSAALT
ncbi:UNVERIFIED_CONTAM: hypothetical protein Sindi_2279800 [Sesamum indicum]